MPLSSSVTCATSLSIVIRYFGGGGPGGGCGGGSSSGGTWQPCGGQAEAVEGAASAITAGRHNSASSAVSRAARPGNSLDFRDTVAPLHEWAAQGDQPPRHGREGQTSRPRG